MVKKNDYNETEVDSILTRERNRKKVRQRIDDEDREADLLSLALSGSPSS